MSLKIFASSGGGVRIGASFGAELEGDLQGVFQPAAFDFYVGTSAGALDAALTANGWTAQQKLDMFRQTDFGKFFTPLLVPYGLRKALAVQWPISLSKLSDFYRSLCERDTFGPALRFLPNLLINTVDADANQQVVYCRTRPDFAVDSKRLRWEVGTVPLWIALTRSSVLPGLVADSPKFMDGGIAENPLLSPLPRDARILLIHLGYPGLVRKNGDAVPRGILDRALYAYEFKAFTAAEDLMAEFPNLRAIYPKIYNVDSAAFNLSREDKVSMALQAMANTRDQWKALKIG